MDDNKILTLASNERIALTPTMRLLFEISNLRTATPATVSGYSSFFSIKKLLVKKKKEENSNLYHLSGEPSWYTLHKSTGFGLESICIELDRNS